LKKSTSVGIGCPENLLHYFHRSDRNAAAAYHRIDANASLSSHSPLSLADMTEPPFGNWAHVLHTQMLTSKETLLDGCSPP
jgi:hypothetical protein